MSILILQSLLSSNTPLYLRHRSAGRLRVAGEYFALERTPLLESLRSHEAIDDVQQNPLTSSLLLCFDEKAEDEVFRHLLAQLPTRERLDTSKTATELPRLLPYVGGLMRRANRLVHSSTYGWFDAQVLVPTFLCLYGVRRMLLGQPRLPTWITVFWWSYATLWNLSQLEKSR